MNDFEINMGAITKETNCKKNTMLLVKKLLNKLERMQKIGVIKLSKSPVVLVRKGG